MSDVLFLPTYPMLVLVVSVNLKNPAEDDPPCNLAISPEVLLTCNVAVGELVPIPTLPELSL